MSETKQKVFGYCPRCGYIYPSFVYPPHDPWRDKCILCPDVDIKLGDPKWGITVDKHIKIMNQQTSINKPREECIKEWNELCTPFWEEVVKKEPEFNQYMFDHRDELRDKMLTTLQPKDTPTPATPQRTKPKHKEDSSDVNVPLFLWLYNKIFK